MSAHAESTTRLLDDELAAFEEPFPPVVEDDIAAPLVPPVAEPLAEPLFVAPDLEPFDDPLLAVFGELELDPLEGGKSEAEPPQLVNAAIPKKAAMDWCFIVLKVAIIERVL
jgi:hypothetical protein